MGRNEFNDLVTGNFDVSFNYRDVFYAISTYSLDGKDIISLADENLWFVEFSCVEDLDEYVLGDKKIIDIIESLTEEEIFY